MTAPAAVAASPGKPGFRLPKPALRLLALWAVLIAFFLANWVFLSPPEHPSARGEPRVALPVEARAPAPLGPSPLVVGGLAGLCAMAWIVVTNRRVSRRVAQATRLLLLPDDSAARAAFRDIAKSRLPVVATRAHFELTRIAMRGGRFDDALASCADGLRRGENNAVARQLLIPALRCERAVALAALGRGSEAESEMRTLGTDFPAYASLTAAHFRTNVLLAVRQGDLANARRLAAQRTPDLPLGLEEEMLADALVLTGGDAASPGELARITGELGHDENARRWLHAVWPEGEASLHAALARVHAA
jgi:hypothetical protein